IGGHWVQGHVDAAARVASIGRTGSDVLLAVEIPGALRPYVAPKGSLAVDGVSLTVAAWEEPHATVALVPYTLEHTIASEYQEGGIVNLEVDILAREARGLICVSMTSGRLGALGLSLMAPINTARFSTPFTVSVDLLRGTTSGSSAHDRALTIRALADPKTKPEDLARPGHVFPLRALDEGVLKRPGHTEAALDLVRLAGLRPAGLLCEILSPDGRMASGHELIRIARRHRLKLVTIRDLIRYRYRHERHVKRVASSRLPTR